jgi:hypothetical protein
MEHASRGMRLSGILTTVAALSLVVALQVGGIKNDTSLVQGNVSSTETPMIRISDFLL